MTDYYDDDYDVAEDGHQATPRSRFAERVSTWFGAFMAVSVIGGLGYWGYGLTQRDIAQIPVISAAIGPAKVRPEEPAKVAGKQPEITSYNAGSTAPQSSPAPAAKAPAPGTAPATVAGSSPVPAGSPVIAFAPPPDRPAAEDLAMGVLKEGGAAVEAALSGEPPAPVPETQEAASDLAPMASPPVLVRPADLSTRVAAALAAESEDSKLAASAAASAVQIQLGAFPERALTESEWTRIYKANEDILHGRALAVQSTISGGRRYFRMRVGPFKDRIEAQNVCRALQARKQDCLVAVNN